MRGELYWMIRNSVNTAEKKLLKKINVELNKNDSNLIYICWKDNSILITKCPICNRRIDIDKIVKYNKEIINNEITLKEPIKCECGLVSLKIKIPETTKFNNNRNIYETIETNNKKIFQNVQLTVVQT